MKTLMKVLAATTLALLIAPPSAAASYDTVAGQVVEVRQAADGQGRGPFTEVKLRTRANEERWVRLGFAEGQGDAYRVGDRVRARVRTEEDGAGVQDATSVHNQSTGTRERLRSRNGEPIRVQERMRARDGSCAGDPGQRGQRDRAHEPGTGGGAGAGGGRRGGGGR